LKIHKAFMHSFKRPKVRCQQKPLIKMNGPPGTNNENALDFDQRGGQPQTPHTPGKNLLMKLAEQTLDSGLSLPRVRVAAREYFTVASHWKHTQQRAHTEHLSPLPPATTKLQLAWAISRHISDECRAIRRL
jgi:hypothetical protein